MARRYRMLQCRLSQGEQSMVSNRSPAGTGLPMKLDATTNREFAPIPLDLILQEARQRAFALAGQRARRLGVTRRQFLASACGAASSLLALNVAHAAAGRRLLRALAGVGIVAWKTYTRSGCRRPRLLDDGRCRHRFRRARANSASAISASTRGPLRAAELRTFDPSRHRPDCQTRSGRQLPPLPRGLGTGGKPLSTPGARKASTHR